jgi:plastocyanin
MLPRTRFAPALIALTLVVGACSGASGTEAAGSQDEGPSTEGPDQSGAAFADATGLAAVEVEVRDNTFDEQFLEVTAGTTITFANVGRTEHNVYPVADGAFAPIDATELGPDDSRAITFEEPGEVPYYCTLHGTTTKGMVGTIRVVA